MLTEQEIKSELNRLAPFHHRVELPHGLSTHVPEKSRRPIAYTRVSSLVSHAFPTLLDAFGGSLRGQRVLDVACNCGGFSVEAAKAGAEYVLGIDIVDHYLEQANFIKQALGMDQIEFKKLNIKRIEETVFGQYDLAFCFGILYHLENPVSEMKRLASVTKRAMLIDTTVVRMKDVLEPIWLMNSPPVPKPGKRGATTNLWRSETQIIQFTPNVQAVIDLLRFLGFPRVDMIEPRAKGLEERYYKGKRVTLLAQR